MKTLTHDQLKKELLKNEEFKKEYDALQSEYDFIVQLYKARTNNNYSQDELSAISGIDQANISKIESGTYSPSLKTMKRLADALDMDLKIELVPKRKR